MELVDFDFDFDFGVFSECFLAGLGLAGFVDCFCGFVETFVYRTVPNISRVPKITPLANSPLVRFGEIKRPGYHLVIYGILLWNLWHLCGKMYEIFFLCHLWFSVKLFPRARGT